MSGTYAATSVVVFLIPITSASGKDESIIIAAAQKAFSKTWTAGELEGRYRVFQRSSESSDWNLTTDATIKSRIDRGKYRVRLDYTSEPLEIRRRIIIYDNSAVLSSRFSGLISRVGAEGEIDDGKNSWPNGPTVPTIFDFHWDISRLDISVFDLEGLLQNRGDEIALVTQENGDIKGTFPVGRSTIAEFVCAKKFGYNLAERRAILPDGWVYQLIRAEWVQSGDEWRIARLEETTGKANESNHRWLLEIEKWSPHEHVPDEEFTLAALDLPPGARILDHRPNIDRSGRFRYIPYSDLETEAALTGLADSIDTLPTTLRPSDDTAQRWRWRFVFLALNVLLVIVLGFLLWRKRLQAAKAR